MKAARAFGFELRVLVSGELVGLLHRDREGRTYFTPDASWLEGGQHPPLGLAFLANPGRRLSGSGLPPWFDNLLPERGSALRQRICQERKIRETDSASLLQVLGYDLPGAVEVAGDVDSFEDDDSPASIASGKIRFSLAGMQLKFSMIQSGDRFALPASGDTGRWIVKLPGNQFPELSEVEAATMAWARSSGLRIPRNHLLPLDSLKIAPEFLAPVSIASSQAFAIERFDRLGDGSRIHQEDFAQALEITAIHKYADDGPRRTSYDGLARLVRDACGPDAQNDFIERLAFIIASGNGDAHLKNWTFQWGREHRPWLSPCYDLVATISWSDFGWQAGCPKLALALGRSRRFADLDRDRVRAFAERANAPDGEERFLAALEKMKAAWITVAERTPERMRQAVQEHWRQVPILRILGKVAGG